MWVALSLPVRLRYSIGSALTDWSVVLHRCDGGLQSISEKRAMAFLCNKNIANHFGCLQISQIFSTRLIQRYKGTEGLTAQ